MRSFVLILSIVLYGMPVLAAAPAQRRAVGVARAARTTSVATRGTSRASTATSAQSVSAPSVVARAGAKQSVIGTGTKVAAAAVNPVSGSECGVKFNGCMDSFCMLDNISGGRCICSNKKSELDEILTEIERLDAQSYRLATIGVDQLQMGEHADQAVANVNKATGATRDVQTRGKLDLSLWDTQTDSGDGADFSTSGLIDKTGAELYNSAVEVCAARMPECATNIDSLKLIYNQYIKSDCTAYENALKKQKADADKKMATAQSAMRTAALDKIHQANKYDLGQCTIEFTECMKTTAECGADFSKCATMSALDSTNSMEKSTAKPKIHGIKTGVAVIEIQATTYDALFAKKPLCDTILKSCDAVADKVWDAFLRANAPQIKNAELIAENTMRQECIGRISDCFAKGCKDNIDPKDPDGSYDMCLTRPETMLSVCKVPLNSCGVDASNVELAVASPIWNFVVDRLASMRVDSCTKQVKECLTGEGNCGENYANCVGLDTDTIVRMCPYDKLVGCQERYRDIDIHGDEVYDELATMVRGLMINIDNEMLTHCQKALDESMLRVCGATDNCDAVVFGGNADLGAGSLDYGICNIYANDDGGLVLDEAVCRADASMVTDGELGYKGTPVPMVGMISGQIYWGMIEHDDKGHLTDAQTFLDMIADDEVKMSEKQQQRISKEINALQHNVDSAITMVESDTTVQYCMTGRSVPGAKLFEGQTPRFPELTKSVRKLIASHALKTAKDNYGKKYDELTTQMLRDQATITERSAELEGKNARDVHREMARKSCVALAPMSAVPRSAEPPKNMWGTVIIVAAIVIAVIVVSVVTFGAGAAPAAGGAATGISALLSSAASATVGAATTAAGAAASASVIAAGGSTLAAFSAGMSAGMVAGYATVAAGAIVGAGLTAGGVAGAVAMGRAANTSVNDAPRFYTEADLKGTYELKQWNYRETVETKFDVDTFVCEKCVTTQNCSDPRNPMFGNKNCKKWGKKKTTCSDIQF